MGVGGNFSFFLVPPKFSPNSRKELSARRINTIVLMSIVPKRSIV